MRKDGRRIKTAEAMYQVAMHIMAERNDALNMIKLRIKEKPIHKYICQKRREGIHISHLSVILASFVRTLSQYPALNRFIVNKRLYARNEIAVGMVVLKPDDDDGTMNKMYFKPENTIFDVQKIVDSYINQNRAAGETNSTDIMISKLLSIPGLCRLGVSIFKWMDKHNLLPRKIIEASPFHCTMTITNLASIKTNYIYHHVYNFGTTSMIMAMGNMEEVVSSKKGEIVLEKCIPIGLVMDERIISGHIFANAFRQMEVYLNNPELLEIPPEKVVEDIA
jgi:pyruvate/2-oxoglutarate dehydrogenase complex dihydrolipoamide acyltransferase (E2) component